MVVSDAVAVAQCIYRTITVIYITFTASIDRRLEVITKIEIKKKAKKTHTNNNTNNSNDNDYQLI